MLDMRTMYFLLTLSCVVAGICFFWMQIPNPVRRLSARQWGAGNFLVGAGLLLVGLRDIIPLWPSAVLGNSLPFCGFLLFYSAFNLLLQKPQTLRRYIVVALAYFIIFHLLVSFDIAVRHRIATVSLMLVILSVGMIYSAHSSKDPHTKNARRLMQIFYSVVLINSVARGLHSEFFSSGATLIFEATPMQILSFISYYFALIGAGIGYLLMHSELAYSDLAATANTDILTGVRNRRNFMEMAERDWALAQRMCRPLSVMMLDLDHFKKINDEFGHLVGDEALRRFGEVLNNAVRTVDLVGRYGGEEFCVVLSDTGPDLGRHSAERIRHDFAALEFMVKGRRVPLSVSIGIAGMVAGDTRTMAQLLGAADEALYAAKKSGRNCVHHETTQRLDTAALPLT